MSSFLTVVETGCKAHIFTWNIVHSHGEMPNIYCYSKCWATASFQNFLCNILKMYLIYMVHKISEQIWKSIKTNSIQQFLSWCCECYLAQHLRHAVSNTTRDFCWPWIKLYHKMWCLTNPHISQIGRVAGRSLNMKPAFEVAVEVPAAIEPTSNLVP